MLHRPDHAVRARRPTSPGPGHVRPPRPPTPQVQFPAPARPWTASAPTCPRPRSSQGDGGHSRAGTQARRPIPHAPRALGLRLSPSAKGVSPRLHCGGGRLEGGRRRRSRSLAYLWLPLGTGPIRRLHPRPNPPQEGKGWGEIEKGSAAPCSSPLPGRRAEHHSRCPTACGSPDPNHFGEGSGVRGGEREAAVLVVPGQGLRAKSGESSTPPAPARYLSPGRPTLVLDPNYPLLGSEGEIGREREPVALRASGRRRPAKFEG